MGDACDLDELLDAARDGDLSKAQGSAACSARSMESSQPDLALEPALTRRVTCLGQAGCGNSGGQPDKYQAAQMGSGSNQKMLPAVAKARLLLRHSDLERWTPLHFAAGNDHGEAIA